ncbi:putative GIY-YIG family Seg-like homing endonuclease [Sinorhizobium phage phiM7]|uniref:Putative GIY-YIG family Seg-like homing endonuclease n=2 Tax=Emdodecavirus TaxID=1980937 RepID=A0A0F6YPE9_9CAUD|nr:putative GIY-YIG family Seg-like homing endonuclease [Sinorhizobium phage phiN3]YP_009601319.1 putative GIY-YIG family Seg-like homing endonuclease [Sinorhizobium phage phiM7]AKF12739.1 putative GIY-YIG family Seg-like homing endonuclease [Sinorhizobium phage phiM7]AKF13099.1 putative GIY-YIG family Seg-like homing endonuclease [Sinorhizobium phage phiM19]AKF13469.1 putative GIY-YIG family Seg-like homing endonuclease [Sinorhizobium phage phiN3]
MHHFTYRTTLEGSARFYVGRHSTDNLDDGYFGSGKWVRSIKDKSKLKREILEFATDIDELKLKEAALIASVIHDDYCMNFNDRPVGFGSGDFNPNRREDRKQILSERMTGENNPMYGKTHAPEVLQKFSEIMTGDNNPAKRPEVREKISQNVSKARQGITYSDEGRKKLSESRKQQFLAGKQNPNFTNKGRTFSHSEETKEKMRGTRGKWYNNGIEAGIYKEDDIPDGWVPGRLKFKTRWE